ncbi:hypothetical protein HQ81_0049 [Dickeya phage phiDP23.1]|uniref:Uncharacterized protein n=10 Tax=Aglimvirinae TaxID=2169530 RepID=A0A7L4YGT2_9CAUD|nr:hypothetical protein HQ80_0072 [Dickeya phage phiD3]AIM51943.1 hypothetical protein HQ81_0049 [Dickeya phage phiDP23.1]AYN55651.1 hypothetical protein [Dickeya phage Kamild]QHB41579.1 hypothetical protein [Dickeya phage Ds5CZ]QHB41781.1 hypothetical protein [Dickeya phage Ds9CZ]QHB41984.1 hypothetical protein [Dickeya phage Ds16CZ]QHB42187.1 hypothetical protein [Dickeya phage Ds20CZ]QHB42385.1 hypothetical protein [Dickeya phage Ds23CZ]QHB42582.1 hypothetical protein [Dickeya phage Ds25
MNYNSASLLKSKVFFNKFLKYFSSILKGLIRRCLEGNNVK